jgi:hypothetical protein
MRYWNRPFSVVYPTLDSNGHVVAVMACDVVMVLLLEYCERIDDLAASDP